MDSNTVDGKINCWKRFQTEWTTKLMNDDSFTDAIPSNQADFVALVTARSDYKTRKNNETRVNVTRTRSNRTIWSSRSATRNCC